MLLFLLSMLRFLPPRSTVVAIVTTVVTGTGSAIVAGIGTPIAPSARPPFVGRTGATIVATSIVVIVSAASSWVLFGVPAPPTPVPIAAIVAGASSSSLRPIVVIIVPSSSATTWRWRSVTTSPATPSIRSPSTAPAVPPTLPAPAASGGAAHINTGGGGVWLATYTEVDANLSTADFELGTISLGFVWVVDVVESDEGETTRFASYPIFD